MRDTRGRSRPTRFSRRATGAGRGPRTARRRLSLRSTSSMPTSAGLSRPEGGSLQPGTEAPAGDRSTSPRSWTRCVCPARPGASPRALASSTRPMTPDGPGTWFTEHASGPLPGHVAPTLRCRGAAAWLLLAGGFAAGSQGYAAYSTRDGIHWRLVLGQFLQRRVPRLDAYAGPFSVVNASTAFFVGSCPACGYGTSLVARTYDGGLHWRRSRRRLAGYFPTAVSFADRRTGFLLTRDRGGPGGVVWKTEDAGRTWQRVLRSAAL